MASACGADRRDSAVSLRLALQIAADVITMFVWVAIMTTGKLPRRTVGIQCMAQRVSMRSIAFAACLIEGYPPWSISPSASDPGDYPGLRIHFHPQYDNRNRVTVGVRLLLIIPNAIFLAPLVLASLLAAWSGWIVVLLTGRWPEALRRFIINVMCWNLRMQSYMDLLVDDYPSFRLSNCSSPPV